MARKIYDKAVWELMHEFVHDHPSAKDGITRDEARRWFGIHYPKVKPATVGLHFEAMSVNVPGRKHHPQSKNPNFHLLYRLENTNTFIPYDRSVHGPPKSFDNDDGPNPDTKSDPNKYPEDSDTFAMEHHLRDYLSRNMHLLGQEMLLFEDDGRKGIEYPVDKGFIDILALDSNQNLVVVELKVSRGYDRTVGQILYYMNWLRQNLADDNQHVRGIIIASSITDKLRLACDGLDDISLLEYQLSVSLHPLASS